MFQRRGSEMKSIDETLLAVRDFNITIKPEHYTMLFDIYTKRYKESKLNIYQWLFYDLVNRGIKEGMNTKHYIEEFLKIDNLEQKYIK